MAFKTIIKIAGKEFETTKTSYNLVRDVDQKGMPASKIYSGKIVAVIKSSADTSVLAAMVNDQTTAIPVTITYMSGQSDTVMKKLELTEAYIVGYHETFSSADANPMVIRLEFTAHKLKMGPVTYENEWPKK